MSLKSKNHIPPKLANRFLNWFLWDELAEEVQGDLEERFYVRLEKSTPFKAKLDYWRQVFNYLRPFAISRSSRTLLMNLPMLRNYVKTAYRSAIKHKTYSAINIFGLTIGLIGFLVIMFYVQNEMSYDKFHANNEHIYRINMGLPDGKGGYTNYLSSQPALANEIRDLYPQVEKSTRLRYVNSILLTKGEIGHYETQGYYADSSFLDIFSFKLKLGDPAKALDEPNSVIMTAEMATKYFSDPNPLGQIITLNNNKSLKLTGILDPVPVNSHIQFDFLISFDTYEVPQGIQANLQSWRWLGFLTYVQLTDGADPIQLTDNIDEILMIKTELAGVSYKSEVQPLADIYFNSANLKEDPVSLMRSGNEFSVIALGTVAGLILIIAGFNFMNLTSVLYAKRVKEIGLRKILGADRFRVIFQLLLESSMVTFVSFALAIIILIFSFEYINQILGWNIDLAHIQFAYLVPILIFSAMTTGIFVGFYPSVFLSQINITSILNRSTRLVNIGGVKVRNILIVIQFAISISLITGTLVITRQIDHLNNQSLGFDREHVVTIRLLPEDMSKYFESFKNAMDQQDQIIAVSNCGRDIGQPWPTNFIHRKDQRQEEGITIQSNWVGYDYFETMDIPIKEGRSFSRDHSTDPNQAVILNTKAVELLGLEQPIGSDVQFFGERKVIGVSEDFNFSSLHNSISPVALILPFVNVEFVYIRLGPGNISHKIALIEEEWGKIAPGIPLDFSFMDARIARLYEKEQKLSGLISIFSGIAISLACLGLYGLISVMVSNKVKDVSIRKVLGADVFHLMFMMSKSFFSLIFFAIIIAWPVANLVLKKWLESFAYRIDISWHYVAIASFISLVIAFITVANRIYQTSTVNPVKHLKDE